MRSCTLYIILLTCLTSGNAHAQEADEYRMEVGGALAITAYEGDFNGSILSNMKPMAAVTARYKHNPRMAWAAQIATGKIEGSSRNVTTWYPELHANPVDFSTSLTDFSLRYEYNFWPFGTGKEYLGAKPLTPYITMGLGLAFTGKPKLTRQTTDADIDEMERVVPPDPDGVVALQMPIGLGVKYKLRDRLNLVAEWTMHFTGSDKLDGVKDPYGIESSGLFKNTDCFSTLQLSLTYDIWAKCKACHNDRN